MVIIRAPDDIHMQRDACGEGPALQAVMDHLGVEGADHGGSKPELADEKGPGGDVDDGAGEGLVQGSVGVSVPRNSLARPQGVFEACAHRDHRVLHGVVVVDRQVPLTSHQ